MTIFRNGRLTKPGPSYTISAVMCFGIAVALYFEFSGVQERVAASPTWSDGVFKGLLLLGILLVGVLVWYGEREQFSIPGPVYYKTSSPWVRGLYALF